jgi:hypothetical protein
VQWGGIEYAVSFVPHNATEYNFDYSVGYLASICIYRFPMPHWTEKSVAKAVSPFGALVAVDPVSFSDTDFSTISIIVHVECISKIPRLLVVKQGGLGTLAWIDIVGFLDLSLPPSPPPSPPLPPAPGFIPIYSSSSDEDSLAGFSDDTLSDRVIPRGSPVSVLRGPGGSSSAHVSQEIAEHVNPSEEDLMATPESMLAEASAMGLLRGEQTPPPNLPAPGFAMTGGLEDIVGPLFTEATMTSTVAPATSPKLMREKEPRKMIVEESETYDISSLFATPTPQRFVPHEEVVATLNAMVPRRSKRVAEQCDGEYISALDRAVQRKVRGVEGLGETGQTAHPQKKNKGPALDKEKAQPPMQVGDLLYLGKACGFGEAELVKISDAAKQFENE